jgi:hypothetical protein
MKNLLMPHYETYKRRCVGFDSDSFADKKSRTETYGGL